MKNNNGEGTGYKSKKYLRNDSLYDVSSLCLPLRGSEAKV